MDTEKQRQRRRDDARLTECGNARSEQLNTHGSCRVANQQSLVCLSGSERRRPGWFLNTKYQTCCWVERLLSPGFLIKSFRGHVTEHEFIEVSRINRVGRPDQFYSSILLQKFGPTMPILVRGGNVSWTTTNSVICVYDAQHLQKLLLSQCYIENTSCNVCKF